MANSDSNTAEVTSALTFYPPCGPVVCWRDGNVLRASGIPYARAERFEIPVLADDWVTPLKASTPGPSCPQTVADDFEDTFGTPASEIVFDEHCQHVSVTMPADMQPDEKLPVMVWIHGGSYVAGSGDVATMDLARIVEENRVVAVAVTYRLGVFGYVGDGVDRPANLGLLDQIKAFEWVQRNIAAFGGDPSNVTAFGQSAGADSIAHIMATAHADRLFCRAIMQSPPLGLSRKRQRMYKALGKTLSLVGVDDSSQSLVRLESRVTRKALAYGPQGIMPFGTQYGHYPLPAESEVDAAWRSVAPKIDVIIGNTVGEVTSTVDSIAALRPFITAPVVGRVARSAIVKVFTWLIFTRGVSRFAKNHVRGGGNALQYTLFWEVAENPYGATHSIDLPLVVGSREGWSRASMVRGASWDLVNYAGAGMRRLWADFAKGETLPDSGAVPNVLMYRRVRSTQNFVRVVFAHLGR